MDPILRFLLTAVVGYLLGSISTGLIVAGKVKNQVDLRQMGSKSTGATNVLRVLGKKPAAITFVGDFIKVLLACLAGLLIAGQEGAMVGGLAGVIGHNWPVYHGFRGGKGVASSIAVMLFVFPLQGGIAIAACILIIAITRYVSLGSITMLLLYAILVCILQWGNWLVCLWAIVLAALCVWRHQANIKRLISGTESKVSFKS